MDHGDHDEPVRDTTSGRFVKGHKQLGHRRKGVPNLLTAEIHRAAFGGGARHGSDGKGTGGFEGYCEFLARHHPALYVTLIRPLIPAALPVNADDPDAPRSTTAMVVNVIAVPNSVYVDHEGNLSNGFNVHELPAPTVVEQEPEPIDVEHIDPLS